MSDHPNRLLVTATTEAGETYAEVAHEAIFRRWDKLQRMDRRRARVPCLAQRSRSGAPRLARTPASKIDALLLGFALTQAQSWLAGQSAQISANGPEFIALSRKTTQRRRLRVQALFGVFFAAIVAGLAAWRYEQWLNGHAFWLTNVRGHVLTRGQRAERPDVP